MTRPTVIFFGPDGSRTEGLNGRPKIFLRALLISDAKRGRIIQSVYATLSHKEARQNFNVWVYGDDRLVRGSGLHINDTGLATNHHFLLPEGKSDFQFQEGDYVLDVFAEILGDRSPTQLLSQILKVTSGDAAELATGQCGLYFDWGPQASQYHSHIDRKPRDPPTALKDALMLLVEEGANSDTIPKKCRLRGGVSRRFRRRRCLERDGLCRQCGSMDVHPLIDHRPDPDHPGWWTWAAKTDTRFNSVIGKLLVRPDGPGRGACRMFPEARHSNLGDMVHGGAILTFIDMALFAGGRLAGAEVNRAVTLDLNTRFLGQGRIGVPLDAEVELLRETGRLIFLQGRVVQEDEIVASFSGMLRKFARKP